MRETCKKEYSNRAKPEYCSCGNFLGGNFIVKKPKEIIAPSVEIWSSKAASIRSVRVTPNDDQNFVFVGNDGNENVCHVKKCLELRSVFLSSNKLNAFTCTHIEKQSTNLMYEVTFSTSEIEAFTPDKAIQEIMKENQEVGFSTVVKVSPKNYAVKTSVSASSPLGYVHVIVPKYKGQKDMMMLGS